MSEINIKSLMNALSSYVHGDRKTEDKKFLLDWIHKWLVNESVGLYESSPPECCWLFTELGK